MVTSIGVHIVPKGGVPILKLKFFFHQWEKNFGRMYTTCLGDMHFNHLHL